VSLALSTTLVNCIPTTLGIDTTGASTGVCTAVGARRGRILAGSPPAALGEVQQLPSDYTTALGAACTRNWREKMLV